MVVLGLSPSKLKSKRAYTGNKTETKRGLMGECGTHECSFLWLVAIGQILDLRVWAKPWGTIVPSLHIFYLYLSANLELMIHNIVTYGLTMETHWEIRR